MTRNIVGKSKRKVIILTKRYHVKVISFVLILAMAVNLMSTSAGFAVFAAEDTSAPAASPSGAVTNDDLTISGSNSFGNLLANTIQNQNSGNGDSSAVEGYSVTGIEMQDKTAKVAYNAVDNCTLVVAIYTEDGIQMLGSGNANVTADDESVDVDISINEMPECYLVKAFLVDPANNYPLCDVFSKSIPAEEEPTDEIPELYTPNENNIAYSSEDNMYYMNNMVIIVFSDDAEQSEINSVISSINGNVVGKNQYVKQYQVEIATHTLGELRDIISQVESNECVLFAHYDEVIENPSCSISLDDPWYGDVDNEDWNDDDVDGSNWWLEAIEVPGAWEYNDYFSKIKIGIVDSGFDTDHEDFEEVDITVLNSDFNSKDVHGTHVAGIIGAKHNNGKGITGIVWNKELICYDWKPTTLQGINPVNWFTDTRIYNGFISEVEAGARVINCSFGYCGDYDEPKLYSQKEIDEAGRVASGYMATMLQNHDFIVVQSAGNAGGDAINNKWCASITPDNCVDWGKGRASKQNILDRISLSTT